ncbi:carbon-nitrogen hydrolase family protein [Loktanella sp. D2R18]|uniref:carbon-nitrogen hydrolase family protein n=1 Tax=Rhodobacterales TaxID=204455 RepID=UPI000DE89FC6|nr:MULTISPECIES: carbon-nitrogen hydrolase family protein [Rhodobacterales]MDO6590424.1 carbon-nitrogen hydrolase family protein [Yoonia sp. 1_MG-2023]RBW41148.1 carbon-nitrogen hydrolase family protein [Loktanella sp. D2R18]
MKAALIQLNSSDDPVQNLADTVALIACAAAQGAEFVATPEVTNCVSMDRDHQQRVLQHEADDQTLIGLREAAKTHKLWLSVGSLALKTGDPDGRFANRSFVINPSGDIVARYDKIHMFDVAVSETETYKESAGYRPGTRAVIAQTPFGILGLSICFDLRFPYLYRALAQSGAEILLVPAAFSPVTGAAHWETLLRARAIETGSYVLAAAQTGAHASSTGRTRQTYGHSLAISPWGEVLADSGTSPGITMVDIDRTKVAQSRKRIAALASDRAFEGP